MELGVGLVFFLHDALERVFVSLGEVKHLGNFCFRYLIGKDTAKTDALLVYMQHNAGGLLSARVEKTLQYKHDKFHRRVVIIEQQHAIQRGFFGLDMGLRGQIYAVSIGVTGCVTAAGRLWIAHQDRVNQVNHRH